MAIFLEYGRLLGWRYVSDGDRNGDVMCSALHVAECIIGNTAN